MTALERAAMARNVLSNDLIATIFNAGPLTSGITRDTVRDICASHERLRMENEQLRAELAAVNKDLNYWQNKNEIIRKWLENEPTEEQPQ